MRALITGAAGFIGSHALHYFAHSAPYSELIVIDTLNYAGSLERLAWTRGPDARRIPIRFLLHDLRAPLPDYAVRQIGEIDYVFHFAAETHVDKSLVDPLPFVQSNVLGTFHLLEFCRVHQPRLKMFFYVSTDEVYGPAPSGVDHDEQTPHRPSNPYAATKAAAEDLVYGWEHSMGVPTIITNTMNNFGQRQHPEKYMPKIMRALLRGEVITVHGSPDQPGSRKYLHAHDHADALHFLVTHGRRGERYNVVGAVEVNNLELVRAIERLMGKEARIKFVDFHAARPGHDLRYSLDGSKMERMGWTPPTSWESGLRDTVEWTLKNPDWLGMKLEVRV